MASNGKLADSVVSAASNGEIGAAGSAPRNLTVQDLLVVDRSEISGCPIRTLLQEGRVKLVRHGAAGPGTDVFRFHLLNNDDLLKTYTATQMPDQFSYGDLVLVFVATTAGKYLFRKAFFCEGRVSQWGEFEMYYGARAVEWYKTLLPGVMQGEPCSGASRLADTRVLHCYRNRLEVCWPHPLGNGYLYPYDTLVAGVDQEVD
jgi:hypothetical protein